MPGQGHHVPTSWVTDKGAMGQGSDTGLEQVGPNAVSLRRLARSYA